MAFEEQLPEWEAEGTQPPKTKRVEGWQPTEKPPAAWFNWLFNRTYKVLRELQQKAAEKVDVQVAQQIAQQAEQTAQQAVQTASQTAGALAAHLNDYASHAYRHAAGGEDPITPNMIGALSTLGGTLLGPLKIDLGVPLSFINSAGTSLIRQSVRTYAVTSTSPATLLNSDGLPFSPNKTYLVRGFVTGTETDTGAVAIYHAPDGQNFQLMHLFRRGSELNHIDFYIENNVPKVKTWHHNIYYITVFVEEIDHHSGIPYPHPNLSDDVGVLKYLGYIVYHAGNAGPFYRGTGSPEGVVTAPPGAIYQNTNGGQGTTLYYKASGTGNTGWRAVA